MRASSGIYVLLAEVSGCLGKIVRLARTVLLPPIRHSCHWRFGYYRLASEFSPRKKRLTITEDVPSWARSQIISAKERWSHGRSWCYASMNSFRVGDGLRLDTASRESEVLIERAKRLC